MPDIPLNQSTNAMETKTIFIRDGYWHSCYEPYEMPGAWISTRYKLIPKDGNSIPSNGEYKGFAVADGMLRLVSGGEYCNGQMINHRLHDFEAVFDESHHAEYKAGADRGYNGKRRCSFQYFTTKTTTWRDGYNAGRQGRQTAPNI